MCAVSKHLAVHAEWLRDEIMVGGALLELSHQTPVILHAGRSVRFKLLLPDRSGAVVRQEHRQAIDAVNPALAQEHV
jgi:hypothetical protein